MDPVSTPQSSDTGVTSTNRTFERLYGELRSLARAQLNRNGGHALLNTTTLVHESYLRFLNAGEIKIAGRRHFLAYASTVMRSIVVDFARKQLSAKHGGKWLATTLNPNMADIANIDGTATASNEEVLRVHEALAQLALVDERLVKIVEMRYFVGMSEEETAAALDLSRRTVQRGWEKARMFLALELSAN